MLLAAGMAWAQEAPPAADKPGEAKPAEVKPGEAKAGEVKPAEPEVKYDANGRKVLNGPPTKLAFKGATVEQIVPFIVESTGKVVMPQQDVLTRRVTVLSDREMPRAQALDMVLLALQQGGIAVVETPTSISLRDINEIVRQDVPVIGPDESVMDRTDPGTIAQKVYRLKHVTAEAYADVLKNAVPDYAKITIDKESNQVAIMGNISLLQRMELLIRSLDAPPAGAVNTETFKLDYADAEHVRQNIEDLFGGAGARRAGTQNRQQNQPQFRFGGQQPEQGGGVNAAQLRVSANQQQNSVTVVAEPAVLAQIREQIRNYWDRPIDQALFPKVYNLKYSDPVKVRALLEGIFGRAASTPGGAGGGGQQGGQPPGTTSTAGTGRLAGQFIFQAYPDAGQLVVLAKSADNLKAVDDVIAQLDQPQTIGLPTIVELKHANAEDLAEQVNTLLSQDGTLAQIKRSASGLTDSSSTNSPFAQNAAQQQQNNAQGDQPAADTLQFWWQRSRPPTDKQLASNLVGQIRIVPVWRQNALMILAPVEYKASLATLIAQLDQPGRQVLVSAVVVEVSREDATALGFRWSSQVINPTNADNSISITNTSPNTKNNFLPSLFDASVLNTNVNLNLILQALAQKTAVSILSEPKVFTSDNQESEFFSGQDIPFITQSQPNTQGNLVQSFDYKAVGIQLRVRPRITVKRDVDLRVNLELSSVVPGVTLFGGAIVDRRETTTQLIVKNGQTVVISGILRSVDSDIIRKVPLLGDIPIIGALFRSREKSKSNTELLVFITPLVVDNTDDLGPVNEPYIDRMKERKEEMKAPPGLEQGRAVPEPKKARSMSRAGSGGLISIGSSESALGEAGAEGAAEEGPGW